MSCDRSERRDDRGGAQCQDGDAHPETGHQVGNDGEDKGASQLDQGEKQESFSGS